MRVGSGFGVGVRVKSGVLVGVGFGIVSILLHNVSLMNFSLSFEVGTKVPFSNEAKKSSGSVNKSFFGVENPTLFSDSSQFISSSHFLQQFTFITEFDSSSESVK